MRPGFRQAMTWLHDWAGLVIGWLVLAIAAGGTMAVFRQELDAWCHPELARGAIDQAAAAAAAVRWLAAHAAGSPGWYLDLGDARSPGTLAFWSDHGAFVSRTLSPVTGAPDGIRASLGGEFFYRFHFELQLPHPYGRLIAAAAAEMLLTVLVTGIVAHRRMFKDFFTLRTGKGRRSWLDGHIVLGVLSLPFQLTITATGIVTLATLLLPWGGLAAHRGDAAAMANDLAPALQRPAAGRPAPLAPIAPMVRAAAARFGDAGIGSVAIANPGDAGQLVTVTAGEDTAISIAQHDLTFDGTTGAVLREHVERRPAMRLYAVLYGLHLGHFAGLASRWLYFVSGLMLCATIATGMILWVVKPRRQHGVGHHLVERLNVGFVAGLPLAFAVFLIANRLLPSMMAGRETAEVACLFAAWAAALAIGAVRPAAWGWPLLLAGTAVAGGAVPIADLTTLSLPGGIGAMDGIAIGVDAVALAVALMAGAVAWRLRR